MGRIRIPLEKKFYKKFRILARFRYGKGRQNRNKLGTELMLRFLENEGGKTSEKDWKGLKEEFSPTEKELILKIEAKR